MKRILFCIISFVFLTNLLNAEKYYSKQKLMADIDTLYASIHEIHVNMFANISKPDFEKELDRIKLQLKDSMTKIDFYEKLAPLVERLGDGHTSLLFPYEVLKKENLRFFPLDVEINYKDSSVIVVHDYSESDNRIPSGAIITTINHKPISILVGHMFHYISGERTFFKAEELKNRFTPLLYTLYKDTIFTIQYRYKNKLLSNIQPGISYSKRYDKKTSSEQKVNNYTLFIDDNTKIATIEFNSFTNLPRFQKFIDSAFVVIKQQHVNDLIIDIRRNGGGNSRLGDEFFQYISHVPFTQFGKSIVNNSRKRVEYFKSFYSDTITDAIGLKEYNNTTLNQLRENKNRYQGNTFLLISHQTFSSAACFSWAFKYFKMGTTVGEESGGLAVCFGDMIAQVLPNTQLKFGISHKKFYQYGATDNDHTGTIPDFIVPEKNAFIFTTELIKKRKD